MSNDDWMSCRGSYANDLHISPDGAVYFSDSSVIAPVMNKLGYFDTLAAYMLTQLQVSPCFSAPEQGGHVETLLQRRGVLTGFDMWAACNPVQPACHPIQPA